MKVFSARVNKAPSRSCRQHTRSFDHGLESLYHSCTSNEKTSSAKSTRSTRSLRLGRECVSSLSLYGEARYPSSKNAVPHDIAMFRAQRHKRRVKFGDTSYDSWYRPEICTRHLMRNSDIKDQTIAVRERDYCEILGNTFCKACCKTNARKECEDDFGLMFLKPKSATQETRSLTPLSDIVLCKYPPLPQSDSKGLFVRLHEFQSIPPQYYINPVEGIYSHEQLLNRNVVVALNTTETSNDRYALSKTARKEISIVQQYRSEDISTETEQGKPKPLTALRRFKAIGNVTLAAVPKRKSNIFHSELHLKEINRHIKNILKERENETRRKDIGISRKESFKDLPIEPPQITVDFALGIFDPKKRRVNGQISYSANV